MGESYQKDEDVNTVHSGLSKNETETFGSGIGVPEGSPGASTAEVVPGVQWINQGRY